MESKWFNRNGNIYELAEWLVQNDLMAEDYDSLLRLIEKPWKWNDEWKLYQKELADKELEKCS